MIYEDADGNWVDLNYIPDTQYGVNNRKDSLTVGTNTVPGYTSIGTPITNIERLRREVDSLRDIKVFKPGVANQINSEFQKLIKQ